MCILLIIGFSGSTQPSNDNCNSAINMTFSGPGTGVISGTVANATQQIVAIPCGGYTSFNAKDVWYKFVAPSNQIYINCLPSPGLDIVIDVRQGSSCNGTNVACSDDGGGDGGPEDIQMSTTPGTNYFIRLYDYNSSGNPPTTFTFDLYLVVPYGSTMPDLVIQNPNLSSSSIQTGGTITASCNVLNQGGGACGGSSTLGYYLVPSSNTTCNTASTLSLLASDAVSNLSSSASGNESETFSITASPGSYYLMFWADHTTAINEVNEINNASCIPITITAATQPSINLTGNLSFGNVQVGSTAQQTLTIYNTGSSTLNVTGINCPNGFSGSWAGSIPQGNSHNVTITFAPTSAVSYNGTINVSSNATAGTSQIACSGVGTSTASPIISLSGNMNFGNVQVGSTISASLTITNSGTGQLIVTGIVLPSGFIGNYTGSINAGNSQNVTIQFSPTAPILYSGAITVASNATGGINSISCSGTGTTSSLPDLEITFPSVNITDLIPLACTQITYTISNTGTIPSSNSITSFFLSSDHVFTNGVDLWIKDDFIPSIAPTGSNIRKVTVPIPISTLPGIWYVLIIADATNTVAESDETNNLSFVSVNVGTSISCNTNTFPFGDGTFPCNSAADPWGFYKYQCVSYVAWKVNEFFGENSPYLSTNSYPFHNYLFGMNQAPDCYTGGNFRLSDACYWEPILQNHGVTVNNIPSPGSIAHWQSGMNGAGTYGHVAYVCSVSGSTICISEYNWGANYKCKFNSRTIDMNTDPNRPERFIHIEASGLGETSISTIDVIDELIEVYPNPSTGYFTLNTPNISVAQIKISVYNISGQLVFSSEGNSGNPISVDLNDQNNGIYLMHILIDNLPITKKIVITK